MRRFLALILCLSLIFVFCGCGTKPDNKGENTNSTGTASVDKTLTNVPNKPEFVNVGENGSRTDDEVGFQLEKPEVGEKIVVLQTTEGDIYMRLFPESAPITVTNFIGLVENKYYDGLTFHRVINDFMLQTGDPKGNGTGGNSVWGEAFADEFNANLLNIRGAVSMANSGANTNGSQFFINQKKTSYTKSQLDYDSMYSSLYDYNKESLESDYKTYSAQYGASFTSEYPTVENFVESTIKNHIAKSALLSYLVPNEVWSFYKSNGGNITLDGAWKAGTGHTVFAQVFKGMDIVDKIAAVKTDSNDKPETDVLIEKAYTTIVTEEMLNF